MMSVLTLVTGKEDRTLRRVRVSDIVRNPNQPRKYFDPEAIAQLAESIRQYGVLNPLTVRRAPGGGYELGGGGAAAARGARGGIERCAMSGDCSGQ